MKSKNRPCIKCKHVQTLKKISVIDGNLIVGKCLKGMKSKTKDCFEAKL